MLQNLKKEKGFTLIEIVLVLAIAGLIMVIVFLAVSGAQRSRRDTQRKSDAARVLAQAEQYASNNSGAYPNSAATTTTFVTNYLTPATNYSDPQTGAAYGVTYGAGATAVGTMRVVTGTCAAGLVVAGTPRQFAVQVHQEAGGAYCVSNQ